MSEKTRKKPSSRDSQTSRDRSAEANHDAELRNMNFDHLPPASRETSRLRSVPSTAARPYLISRQKSPFIDENATSGSDSRQASAIGKSRSVLFGTEGGVGLDSRGRDLPMFDVEPKYLGYDVPKAFYPHDRPSTINAELYKNAKFPALQSPTKQTKKTFQRPTTMTLPSRSVRQEDGEYAPLRADIITPSAILKYRNERPYIMPPNQLLRVLNSAKMPLSLPKSRSSTSRAGSTRSQLDSSPTTFSDYLELRRRRKRQGVVDPLRPISRGEELDEERRHARGFGPDVVVPVDFESLNQQDPASAAAIVPCEKEPPPSVLNTTAYENEYVDSPEYKRARLMEILTLQVSSTTMTDVDRVAKQQHDATMIVLGHELYDAQQGARLWATRVHDTVAASINSLPLPFLFEQTGGPGYCRERMQKAMCVWVEEFERNQQRKAWLQWKALVEWYRYNQRSQEYFRQAGIRRMREAIDKILNAARAKGMNKWIETTRIMIWSERDSSVRRIQRQMRRLLGLQRLLWLHDQRHVNGPLCDIELAPRRPNLRFQLPPRLRQERREIWLAAIAVQMPYRYRRFRQFMKRKRRAATKIQSLGRMRLEKNRYADTQGKIIFTQALIRMYIHRKYYVLFRASTVLIQNNYRGLKGRRLFRSILQARRRDKEIKFSAVVAIQRVWRGHRARSLRRAIVKQNQDEFWAALVFQRCWYAYNDEWVTFLLLGCLRERDREEKEWEQQVKTYGRNAKARVIQRHFRAFVKRLEQKYALMIQCAWRCFVARQKTERLRVRMIAARKLHWWARVHLARRGRIASRLQFWALRSVPGRFLNHLVIVVNRASKQQEIDTHRRCYNAASRIQALIHGVWTRDFVRHLRAAICIQRHIRGHLGRKYAKAIWTALRTDAAVAYVTDLSQELVRSEIDRRVTLYESSALRIQHVFRGWICRHRLVHNWVYTDRLTAMAVRIQLLWRSTASLRALRRLLNAQRRRVNNPYRKLSDLETILHDAIEKSKRLCDPFDSEAGMGLPTWLHRLALNPLIKTFYAQGVTSLAQLRDLSHEDLRTRFNVPKEACTRILAKLNSRNWIELATQARSRHERIVQKVERVQKPLKSARFAHKRATERREKLEADFDDVSRECSEFRRPPKSLRRKLDRLTQELEEADTKAETAMIELNALESVMANLQTTLNASSERLKEAENMEVKAVYVNRSFEYVDRGDHKQQFLTHFPDHPLKAEAFEKALSGHRVTPLQLTRYFADHSSSSAAKDNVGKLKSFPRQSEMAKWDTKRRLECCDILQYAAERMADLIACDIQRDMSEIGGPIHELVVKTRNVAADTRLPGRPRVWRMCVDHLYSMETKTKAVQRAWKNRSFRMLQSAIKHKKKIEDLKEMYRTEKQTNKVREAWEAERKKEAEEYKEWMREQADLARAEELQYITRFPWTEHWDEENQCCYYYHYQTTEMSWDRPAYTIQDDKAARTIQPLLRGALGRKLARKQRRKLELVKLKAQEKVAWESKSEERERWISIRFNVKKLPDLDREARIEKWRKAHTEHYSRPTTSHRASLAPTERLLDTSYHQFQLSYHKSVLNERRQHEKSNADADAIISMLEGYCAFKRATRPLMCVETRLELTKVAVPFAWNELVDEDTGRPYYFNYTTDQVVWDRPRFTFEEEYAAKKLQSIYRMRLGRKEFRKTLNRVSLELAVRRAIETTQALGWIGFGSEGLTTEMFLYRCGFPHAVPKLQKWSIEDIASLDTASLRAAGIVHEHDLKVVREALDTPGVSDPMCFIPTETEARNILSEAYPNQHGRVSSILNEMLTSATPISNGLLRHHVHECEGKPKVALEQLSRIMNKGTCSSLDRERHIYSVLSREVERLAVYVANWRITTLRDHLDVAMDIALRNVESAVELTEEQIQRLSVSSLEPPAKGLWEHDYRSARQVSLAQACLVLRTDALERIRRWIRAATAVQSAYRAFVLRRWYDSYKQYRSDCSHMIQLCWKQYKARGELAHLRRQYASDYEQLWNDELEAYYYFYHPTEESLWEPPRDEYGQYLPYRPLVKDRRSGRLIKSWPSLDGPTSGQMVGPEEDTAPSVALCSVCKAQEASRVCDYCFSDTGDYIYSCFACFAVAHNNREDMKWHTYQSLHKVVADALRCIECNRLATRECLQCEDSFCDRCYGRIHRKGKRAEHDFEHFAPGAVVCIECEKAPAAATCETCQDSMCTKCRLVTHAKGNKSKHKWMDIVQELQPGQEYCQQCACRPVIRACESCEMQLCQHCLHREHEAICPDYAVFVKSKQLYANHMCVECGKPADRRCDTCGDKYCSIVWMGNPGCFERFHSKGNRMEHVFTRFKAEEKPAELKEIEKRAAEALAEKKRLEAKFAREEKERLEQERLEAEKPIERGEAKMDTFVVGQCRVSKCQETVFEQLPFCPIHTTPQNVLEIVKDPIRAAKYVADAQIELSEREKNQAPTTVAAGSRKKSLKQLKKLGKSVHDMVKYG